MSTTTKYFGLDELNKKINTENKNIIWHKSGSGKTKQLQNYEALLDLLSNGIETVFVMSENPVPKRISIREEILKLKEQLEARNIKLTEDTHQLDIKNKKLEADNITLKRHVFFIFNSFCAIENNEILDIQKFLNSETLSAAREFFKEVTNKSIVEELKDKAKKLAVNLISFSIFTGVASVGVFAYNKIDNTAPDLSRLISITRNIIQDGKYEFEFGLEGPSVKLSSEKEKVKINDHIEDTLRDEFYSTYNKCTKNLGDLEHLRFLIKLVDVKQAEYSIDGKTYVSEKTLNIARQCLSSFDSTNGNNL